jgi:hypothetical protein
MPGLCDLQEPPLAEVEPGHLMRCHIPIDELRRLQSRSGTLGAEVEVPDVAAVAVAPTATTNGSGGRPA